MAQGSEITLQHIEEMYQKIQDANHYDLLGVPREGFDPARVGGQYRMLAKTWHVDRLAKLNLSPQDKAKVQEIFSAITQAHRTLSSDEKRQEYDMQLDGGGESVDVAALLEADSLFLRGRNTLGQGGGYKGAHDMFLEASKLNPEDRNIRIYLLYTEFMLMPKSKSGEPLNRSRGKEIYETLDGMHEDFENTDWFKVLLGTIAEGMGQDRKAIYLYREALMINPNNREAQRQKRLFEMRKDKEENSGLLDKIKSFFNR